MLVGKKTCRLKKEMSVGEFPLPKTDMSGMSRIAWNAATKNARGRKNPPRAYRGGKKGKKVCHLEEKKFFCRLEKQNVDWKKKLIG